MFGVTNTIPFFEKIHKKLIYPSIVIIFNNKKPHKQGLFISI